MRCHSLVQNGPGSGNVLAVFVASQILGFLPEFAVVLLVDFFGAALMHSVAVLVVLVQVLCLKEDIWMKFVCSVLLCLFLHFSSLFVSSFWSLRMGVKRWKSFCGVGIFMSQRRKFHVAVAVCSLFRAELLLFSKPGWIGTCIVGSGFVLDVL